MESISVVQKLDKKTYFRCSMYYLKRFLGLREIILVTLLFAVSVWLYAAYDIFIALIFFGVTAALIIIAVALFLITGILGYKHDYEKMQTEFHKLDFLQDRLVVTSLDKAGEPIFSEDFPYQKIEKIALRKNEIFIYAAVAINYYVTQESMKENTLDELKEWLMEKASPDKFKIKKTVRRFPKKKKIKLGEE
ncbi:MAG: hypothetical protein GX242_04090 [Clostridiales bacterium]|nr:hypothetical protein [Clostridiales bacterium]